MNRWWTFIFLELLAVLMAGWLVGCAPKSELRQEAKLGRSSKSALNVRDNREADVYCTTDNECLDGDPTTEDLCLISGECVHIAECQTAADCPTDNEAACVGCYEGLCVWYCCPEVCPDMDINCDGKVNATDLGLFLNRWGVCHPLEPSDWDGDRDVGPADLHQLLLGWTP